MTFGIRAAKPDDSLALTVIERRSGEQFREVGLDHIADDEPTALDAFVRHATEGRSWVAVDGEDRPVGVVVVDDVDGCAHIELISVDPVYQGNGLGRALVDQVRTWAQRTARPAITLTTFAAVPWNAPLYEHLGFVALDDAELGPELRAVRDAESARGLDQSMRRVCMKLTVSD